MRRLLTFALSLSASATMLVALPTITPGASAAPRPVEPGLEQVPLTGADPGHLRSPALTGRVSWFVRADGLASAVRASAPS